MKQRKSLPIDILKQMSKDFLRKAIVKQVKFTGKHMYQSPYLCKASGCRPGTLMKRG